MAKRVIMGLIVLAAIIEGVAPDAVPIELLTTLLVLLGLVWGWIAVDAEDATAYLAVAIAVGLADQASVLVYIPWVGPYLNAILAQVSLALYGGVVTVLAVRILNRLKGD